LFLFVNTVFFPLLFVFCFLVITLNRIISFAVSGSSSQYYTAPAPIVIHLTNLQDLLNSASYILDTSVPSAHAGWVQGAKSGTGMASFDGLTQYLDPMNPLDNGPTYVVSNQAVMPLTYGGTNYGKLFFVFFSLINMCNYEYGFLYMCVLTMHEVSIFFFFFLYFFLF
jgi:hypothetical protein